MRQWHVSSLSEPQVSPEQHRSLTIGEPRQRVRLLVAYDGGAFSGFAKNLDITSVAGVLEAQLGRILGHNVVVTGAGRTDKGVHAWGQVVTFDTEAARFDPTRLVRSLNGLCGPEIVIRAADAVSDEFDARFSARFRRYRYTIYHAPTPNPFLASTAWHLSGTLSLSAMRTASDSLIGAHDFSSFCRRPPGDPLHPPSMSRTVSEATWTHNEAPGGDLLRFEIQAGAFCHQMVRSIVGTLVDIGSGRRKASEMSAILRSKDRAVAGNLAPPHGLCLWEVGY